MRKFSWLASAALLIPVLSALPQARCFAQDQVGPDQISTGQAGKVQLSASLPPELAPVASAQPADASSAANPIPEPAPAPAPGGGGSPRVGVGVTVGTEGVGGQVAVRVIGPLNVRAGFSGIGFGYNFNNDGIAYGAHLRLEGAPLTADLFFFHGIHVSGGALIYNGTRITGTAAVSSGQTFTLNSVSYESSASNPVAGNVGITFRKAAPLLGFGFGNLVPRGSRHWSITSDFGIAFTGQPNAALALGGLACPAGVTSGSSCLNPATTPSIENNVLAEQNNVNNKMKFFKYYPVFSLGFGYAF